MWKNNKAIISSGKWIDNAFISYIQWTKSNVTHHICLRTNTRFSDSLKFSKFDRNIHAILTKVPFDVAENQKVYIEGVLQQNPFVTIDNKKRSAGRIRAFHTSLIDSNYEDINSIELCGFVAGDLIKTTEFSMYRIATHFMPPLVLSHLLFNIW